MPNNDQLDSLMEMFIFETNQLTEELESILLESETKQIITSENIKEIFRIMHTIKGSAAMMTLTHISQTAHILEDLFSYIREEKLEIQVSAICDLVFKGLDYIRFQIEHLVKGEDNSEQTELDQIVAILIAGVSAIKNGQPTINIQQNLTKPQPQKFKAVVFFDVYNSMPSVRAFMVVNKAMEYFGEVTCFPELRTDHEDTINYILENGLTINFTSGLSYYEIKDLLEDISDVKTAVIQLVDGPESKNNAHTENLTVRDPTLMELNFETSNLDKDHNKQINRQSVISVNIHKLDKLIDIVGEIVISESMVTKSPDLNGLNLENFSKSARQLRKLTDELQDMVLSVRMVPVEMCFGKMHRIVRDMSKKLGKEVTLEIIGENTEVDKNIIDNLSDPLMHLIRNSMDHGIENCEERIRNNKNPVGKITLEAKNTGGDVVITVTDDGRGLNRQKIINKAKENGLITKAEGLSDKEVYSFILLPGFSTKEQVTEFSGRGVGMDVVKQNIDNVRGKIFVDSEPGNGTVITIKIPLTLAIIDGMMVKVGDNVYIIPTQSIIQSFRPAKDSIFSDTEGRDMILIRGNCHAVIRLHEIFNVETLKTDYSDGIIIITEYNDKIVCLFADNLLGEQPVVVKSLPRYLSQFKCKESGVGGCTILGDGSISLILDVSELANNNL